MIIASLSIIYKLEGPKTLFDSIWNITQLSKHVWMGFKLSNHAQTPNSINMQI